MLSRVVDLVIRAGILEDGSPRGFRGREPRNGEPVFPMVFALRQKIVNKILFSLIYNFLGAFFSKMSMTLNFKFLLIALTCLRLSMSQNWEVRRIEEEEGEEEEVKKKET